MEGLLQHCVSWQSLSSSEHCVVGGSGTGVDGTVLGAEVGTGEGDTVTGAGAGVLGFPTGHQVPPHCPHLDLEAHQSPGEATAVGQQEPQKSTPESLAA